VILCAVCTVHKKTRSVGFLVWPQNRWFQVSRFGPQNRQLWFGGLGLKITATVSLFRPQNHVGYDLSVAPQNRWEDEDGVGHASRSSGLLHWKQVGLGFSNLTSRLVEAQHRWCTWHHRRGCVELKLKTDGSMRQVTSDPSMQTLPFLLYYALGVF
jgi:hypothetical protein